MASRARFQDPVRDSQAVFRDAMLALSRPGLIRRLALELDPPPPLMPAAAALALALCDFETPVWLDATLTAAPGVTDYLRFETGAQIVIQPNMAAFALIAEPMAMPALDAFALGTLADPDRSTTLVVQVGILRSGQGWRLTGPGIVGDVLLEAAPLRDDCIEDVQRLRQLYPRGVDIFFVHNDSIAGLPRSVLIDA